MNQVTLYGHVGREGEIKYTSSGHAVLGFSLATEEVWHDDKGEKHKKTEWHKCVAWRKLAESLAPYARKGAALIIIGRNETRTWEKDGHKNYTTEVVIKQAGAPIIVQQDRKEREPEAGQGSPEKPYEGDDEGLSGADADGLNF